MSQDPLVLLPFEKWSELQSVFKADWPRSITGYTVLETQRDLVEKGCDYGFKVYCPFGDVRNGMVAVNVKEKLYEIIIQCPQDNTEKLTEALKRTKIVNWQKLVICPFAPYHIIHCIQETLGECDKLELLQSDTFIYDAPTRFTGTELPKGISFGFLTSEHLDLVDLTWPYRYDSSRWYFQLLINLKSGYGLLEGDKLIAWVLINESGILLHLYTVESHRKKGYAELLLKLVSNILIKEEKPVIAFCVKGNVNAYKLYEKLGFLNSHLIAWCYINKNLRQYTFVIIYNTYEMSYLLLSRTGINIPKLL